MNVRGLLLMICAAGMLAAMPTSIGRSAVPDALASSDDCEEPLRSSALAGPLDLVLGTCSGIRPGSRVTSPVGSCTMSWILKSGSTFYATIAGHCANVGDVIKSGANGTDIGEMIYSVNQPIGEDFGIFEIYSSKNSWVNPQLCGWGGPTGIWTGGTTGDVVRHFGFGLGVGTVPSTRARSGVLAYSNATAFGFEGVVMPGDSGSPARVRTGEALGVITDLLGARDPGSGPLVTADPLLMADLALGTRLDHGLSEASAATGITFTLQTAPLDNEV